MSIKRYYPMYDIYDRGDGVIKAKIRHEEGETADWVKYDDIKHLLERSDNGDTCPCCKGKKYIKGCGGFTTGCVECGGKGVL